MYMKNKLLYLFIIISILSCTKDIEIEIPPTKAKMVAISSLRPFSSTNSQLISLELQSTTDISEGGNIKPIGDALVILKRNNVNYDTLVYVDTLKEYFYSFNMTDYPKENEKFDIEIIKEGYDTIRSSTIIPKKIEISSSSIIPIAYYDEDGQPYAEATIEFNDPLETENYYEIVVSDLTEREDSYYELSSNSKIITSESYYPTPMESDKAKPISLLFSDKMINGKSVKINIFFSSSNVFLNDVIPEHYVAIQLRSVTKAYYNYKTILMQHLYALDENILYGSGEPIPVYSNIENGYGIFGSFSNSIARHQIDKTTIEWNH